MPELIDREVTLQLLDIIIEQYNENTLQDRMSKNGLLAARRIVSKQPTIEPEVRHGRWIKQENGSNLCSVCGVTKVSHLPFCGHCGAKMMDEKSDIDEIKYPHKKTINGIEITAYSEEAYEDDVGGFHDCAEGWNPNGVWCGECCTLSCRGCVNENLTKEKS